MLVTEQAVARQIRDLAGQVVERHLDAYAETIVAQEIEEVVTDRSLEQVVRRAGRSVEWQVLTDPFDTSGTDPKQIDDPEVGNANVLHLATPGMKRDLETRAFNRFDGVG